MKEIYQRYLPCVKKVCKKCIFIYIAITLVFLLSPSLNLSKIVTEYENEASRQDLIHLAVSYSIRAYLLSIAAVTLGYLIIKKHGLVTLRNTLLCTILVFGFLLSYFDNSFPTLGQLSLIWDNGIVSLIGVVSRYELLLHWLMVWNVMFIGALCVQYYRKQQKQPI